MFRRYCISAIVAALLSSSVVAHQKPGAHVQLLTPSVKIDGTSKQTNANITMFFGEAGAANIELAAQDNAILLSDTQIALVVPEPGEQTITVDLEHTGLSNFDLHLVVTLDSHNGHTARRVMGVKFAANENTASSKAATTYPKKVVMPAVETVHSH